MPLPDSYTLKPGSIPAYFEAMLSAEAPKRFTARFLESLEFTSVISPDHSCDRDWWESGVHSRRRTRRKFQLGRSSSRGLFPVLQRVEPFDEAGVPFPAGSAG
jgi:hypothetical protein